MQIRLKRRYKGPTYTVGSLFIDGQYFCDTLEDKDRGLHNNDNIITIQKKKVHAQTAIPCGTYRINMETVSPRFSTVSFYKKEANGGRLPRLINVKGFEGVLIHCGNTDKDTEGCILLGENKVKGQVINSQVTFKKFYPLLYNAYKKDEPITIEIV